GEAGMARRVFWLFRHNARPWMKQVAAAIERHRPDLVHTGNTAFSNMPAALAARRQRVPVVSYQKGFEHGGRPNRYVLRRGFYDHHIACSNAVAERMFELGLPRDRCTVLYDGVAQPPEGFDAAPRADDTPVVAMYSLLQRWKGQDVFLRAAALVAPRFGGAVEFVVVGADTSREGLRRARLEALVAELGLGGRVRLSGKWEDTADVLPSFDLFVSASRSEAFGMAMVEAMACGVPVVATATEGAREVVEHGASGLVVPIGDVHALAEAVASLLADGARRKRLGESARESARERFGLGRMIEATERVYAEALGL
nr:glycosyltransferase family 4 protein [Acidobacteriota bacterium]